MQVNQEIKEKKLQLEELEAKLKAEQTRFESLPEIVQIEQERKENDKLIHKKSLQQRELDRKLNLMFTTDGNYPYYNTTQYMSGIQTNILDELFEAIKTVVGTISKLKLSQVGELARKVVAIEYDKHPEKEVLRKEILALNEKNSQLREKQIEIEKNQTNLQTLRHDSYVLKVEIQNLLQSIDKRSIEKEKRTKFQNEIMGKPEVVRKIYEQAIKNIKETEASYHKYKEKEKRM